MQTSTEIVIKSPKYHSQSGNQVQELNALLLSEFLVFLP